MDGTPYTRFPSYGRQAQHDETSPSLRTGVSLRIICRPRTVQLVDHNIRAKISKNFDQVNERQLEQFLSVITKFRNVCAHNERLYSYQTKNDIPNMTLHQKLGIPKKGSQYIYGKHDLFALVIAFRYLLPDEDFKKFKASLCRILKHYLETPGSLSESDLYQYMGFPSNWKKISSYRK